MLRLPPKNKRPIHGQASVWGTSLCSETSIGVRPMRNESCFLPEEEMKLRDDDKTWLSDEIARQLTDVVDSFQPHGWRNLVRSLRELGPIIGTCSFVLALIAAIITLAIFGFSGRTEEATFRGRTEERLKNIESNLTGIKGDLIRQSITMHATLPSAQFKTTLPDIHSSIIAAKRENLKVPISVVEDIAHKMAETDRDAPVFWPTAAAIISYQSSLLVGDARNWSVTFPTCGGTVDILGADKTLAARRVEDGKEVGERIKIERVINRDCYVELDGKTISKWDCKQCLVKYSGGPVSLTDVHLENCLFIFDFSSKPSMRDGERLTEALLASKSQNVNLPAS
jgi:hypothetical protein